MGERMAKNILKVPGVTLTVYNRTAEKMQPLADAGAKTSTNLPEAVAQADLVMTMLSTPEVVLQLASKAPGFLAHMQQDALWVDSTTVAPDHARNFADLAKAAGIRYVEAPVLGSRAPAEAGELVVVAAGDQKGIEQASPLFEAVGRKTVTMGEPGMAASMKILVNLMLAQSVAAYSEAVSLGKNLGLDVGKVQDVLTSTPGVAPLLGALRGKLDSGDTSPNFPLQWMHKDLRLVAEAAYAVNTPMPLANAAKELFAQAKAAGRAEQDFSAIFQHLMGGK